MDNAARKIPTQAQKKDVAQQIAHVGETIKFEAELLCLDDSAASRVKLIQAWADLEDLLRQYGMLNPKP